MKVIVKPSLALTEEERTLLNKVASIFGEIEKNDIHGDLADSILGYCEIGCFEDLSDLIYKIAASAENE